MNPIASVSPPPPPVSCTSLTGRSNLLGTGYYCFNLDSSHPESLAALGGTCDDYYIASTSVSGGVRFCSTQTDGSCRASDIFTCGGLPPLNAA